MALVLRSKPLSACQTRHGTMDRIPTDFLGQTNTTWQIIYLLHLPGGPTSPRSLPGLCTNSSQCFKSYRGWRTIMGRTLSKQNQFLVLCKISGWRLDMEIHCRGKGLHGMARVSPTSRYNYYGHGRLVQPCTCPQACTTQRKLLGGWFYERSNKAGSYRGELLGAVAIHLLTSFGAEFFSFPTCHDDVLCDNMGALNQASITCHRVRVGAKYADVLRSLWYLKTKTPMKFVYTHIKAHQDKYLPWRVLSLVEQLNVHCNALAGQAVGYSLASDKSKSLLDAILPCKSAAVFINGQKLTSDVSGEVRFELGRYEARKFFTALIRISRDINIGRLGLIGMPCAQHYPVSP